MRDRYLEVTFRKGKAIAAYLYLPRRASAKSVRTEHRRAGILIDFGANGKAIGIEITAPAKATVREINAVLADLGQAAVAPGELAPLRAA